MKTKMTKSLFFSLALLVLLSITFFFTFNSQARQEKVSEFGKYEGYTDKVYDGSICLSDFLTLSDGTFLAYDLILPTKDGVPAGKPLPALFMYTPYGRAWTIFDKDGKYNLAPFGLPWYYESMARVRSWLVPNGKGKVMDVLFRVEWLDDLVKSGYAVIVVDRPGTGASFGKLDLHPESVAREADEILNWIAAQEWCDGNIGMFGDSIQAQIQFQAASTGNPYLKAILPATTWMDNYSAIMFSGGVRNIAFENFYVMINRTFDTLATPVDRDQDGHLLAQAREERRIISLAEGASHSAEVPYRDVITPDGENYWQDHMSLYPLLERINQAGVPAYIINGWYDIYTRDNFLIYNNLTVPKRMLVRPVDHSQIESPGADIDFGAEAHRWFDYWLKGIDNGIMEEAPIHYYIQGAEKDIAWQSTEVWPPENQEATRYYFGDKEVGGNTSINDGTLVLSPPVTPEGTDVYTVDYSTTSGNKPRWSAPAAPHKYPNMRLNDAKALTYTTPALQAPVDVVGHPIVHLWLASDAPDLDVFVYLEEVDRNGNSTYITEGNLRASHRALGQAPYEDFGLPFHSYFQSNQQPIPALEPIELVFDLLTTAWQFPKGSRMRITVAFADAGNFDTPVLEPAPRLYLLRDTDHPSYVILPVKK